jgi:hypothetical protein
MWNVYRSSIVPGVFLMDKNNYVEFKVYGNFWIFRDVEYTPKDKIAEKVYIKSGQDDYGNHLIFCLFLDSKEIKGMDSKKVLERAKKIVEHALNIISFKYRAMLGRPIIREFFINGKRPQVTHEGRMVKESDFPKSSEELKQLAKELEENKQNPYITMYRNIMHIQDEVARFILLYSFLQIVIGQGKQKETDKFIRTTKWYDKTKDRKTTKNGKKHKETIFTWLRNSVAHTKSKFKVGDKTLKMSDIIDEIYYYIGTLEKIVKYAIEKNKLRKKE